MSKAVKSVGRAIGKVVKGIGKAVKSIAKSTIGKVILSAATFFIGGPMIAGAINGAAAGSGFLGTIAGAFEGAMSAGGAALSGIGNAASGLISGNMGLSEAASTVMNASGAPFQSGAVGNFLGAGAPTSVPMTGVPMSGAPVGGASTAIMPSEFAGAAQAAAPVQTVAQQATQQAGAGGGLLQKMMQNKYFVPAAFQLGGSLIQGVGGAMQQKAAWARDDDERKRAYENWSVGNLQLRR